MTSNYDHVSARDLWKSFRSEILSRGKMPQQEVKHNLAAQEDNNYKSAVIIQ